MLQRVPTAEVAGTAEVVVEVADMVVEAVGVTVVVAISEAAAVVAGIRAGTVAEATSKAGATSKVAEGVIFKALAEGVDNRMVMVASTTSEAAPARVARRGQRRRPARSDRRLCLTTGMTFATMRTRLGRTGGN